MKNATPTHKVQTVMRGTNRPADVTFFRHGHTGDYCPYTNPKTGKSDPFVRFPDGHSIFVSSLEKYCDIVPLPA